MPTYVGRQETDIPEDFLVTDIVVRVPDRAKYLFFSVLDSLFEDNSDADGDFGVRISRLPFWWPPTERTTR